MVFLAALSLLIWVGILASGAWLLRERIEADPEAPARCRDVTALIPARNEAGTIARCLASVTPQVVHTVVVDDESTDATGERVGASDCTTLVQGRPRPPEWSGKLWALEQGLREVDTPWVLLLDADVEADAHLVGTLHRHAAGNGLAVVSLMVELRLQTLIERWLVPPFVYFFRLLYPFRRANDATSGRAAAAGGCLLVRREALERAGAFASLRDAIIDDCTLAQRIKAAGYNTWIGLTRSARSLRGYAGIGAVTEMVARTAYTQLHYSALRLLGCTMVLALAFWIPVAAMIAGPDPARALGAAAAAATLVSFVPLLRFYGLSPLWSLTLPLAATAYLAMTWVSAIRYWRGIRSRWKQRTYQRSHKPS